MAAAAGGVTNHRMGLWDAILIKNNHIAAAGGVRQALEQALGAGCPVEIEVRTREELREALDAGAKRLLLDNLAPGEAADWVREAHRRGRHRRVVRRHDARQRPAYAETGADFISSGAITHSATAVDMNFRLELEIAVDWLIRRVERTESTMVDAAAEAPGAVVVAEEQTAGQGRLGRQVAF